MNIKTSMFAVPIVGLIVGALLQPVGAQTYTYTRTVTSYDSPEVVERVVEDPVILENRPILMESVIRPVTIEQPVVIERAAVVQRPYSLREHRHFHLGVFPLGRIDVF